MNTVAIFPLILVKQSLELRNKGAYSNEVMEKTGKKLMPVTCRSAPHWLHCGKNTLKFIINVYASVGNRSTFGCNRTIYVDDKMSYVFPG